VLRDFQDTISRIGSQIFPKSAVALVLCPEHAQMFAAAGLSKADVQNWLLERSGRTVGEFRRAGKPEVTSRRFGPPGAGSHADDGPPRADEEFHHILTGPTSIPVIVAGAKNAAISMVVRIFGEWSGTSVPVGEKK
jgi:hypothetical protein